jgi:hypothetical protein
MTTGDFPADYRTSRADFLELCSGVGARVESFEHPRVGSDGRSVATDVAWFGAADAERVLLVVSGTHGVEGLCGAGVQLALLRRGLHQQLDSRVRLGLVHALNPHGFLDLRRTNEDNVDLNRNFLDHAGPYPDDSAYAELHALLVPADWDGPTRAAADAQLVELAASRGPAALQAAISGGQYTFANGLFYGGRAPAWSNVLWRELLQRCSARLRYLAVVDLHSGLGQRGACELISGAAPGSSELRLARSWFGEGIVFPGLTSTAPAAVGYMGSSLAQCVAHAGSALVVAEIGTVPFDRIMQALRADNWIHAYGERNSSLWRDTKAQMEGAFVGRDSDWQETVAARAVAVCERALAGLLDTADEKLVAAGAA